MPTTAEWNIKLKPGQAGLVTYSPDGRWMAVSTAEKVTIMDTNGNPSPAGVLQFSPVITYSEYRYYPTVQWSPDGSRLAVVIPAADPLGGTAPTGFRLDDECVGWGPHFAGAGYSTVYWSCFSFSGFIEDVLC